MRLVEGTGLAVLMRLRAEVRAHWRAWLSLAAVVGLLAGAAIATAAGARRTGSVVERAAGVQEPHHVYIVPAFTNNGDLLDYDEIRRFPEVVESFRIPLPAGAVDGEPTGMVVAPEVMLDGRHQHVVAGRPPQEAFEAAVNFVGRDQRGWRPGTRLTVTFRPPDADPDEAAPADGPRFTFRVTGVLATLGDLGGSAESTVLLTPAFWRAHRDSIGAFELDTFGLRRGVADYPAFHVHMRELTGGQPVFYQATDVVIEQVRRSFQLLTTGLWLLAGFLAIAAALILTQLLLRASATESADHAALRAVGLTPRGLFVLAMARLALVVVAGAAVAAALAFAVSPLFPFGRPRLVEPNPGAGFDAVAIGAGAVLTVLLPLVACAIPLWRASARVGRPDAVGRRSTAAGALARVLPRRPAIGAHLALGPAGGRVPVPVRSSVATTTLGVVTLVAAIVVSASLQHLLATPRLYGWNWDVIVSLDGGEDVDAARLAALPQVASFSTGVTGDGGSVILGDQQVAFTAIGPAGGVVPPVLHGRLPRAANEIALGERTRRHAGLHIGDRLTTRLSGGGVDASFRVVGTVVLPFTNDETALGEGAYAVHAGIRRFDSEIPRDAALVRFQPGTPLAAGVAAMQRAFPEAEVREARRPGTLLDFGRVERFPLAVALTVGLLAAATVAHVLVTAVRGRRRDLAVLRTLGLGRRDVRAAVAWQATILVGLALVVGVPVGIAAGRVLWIACATAYGFLASPVVPGAQLALVVAVAVVLANLIAALPGRIAARTSPAGVLRIE
jgi:ABC-type lipoprotein release transport system permease subunit